MENKPHAPRIGWLKNGNSPGDFTKAIKCGAHARSTGNPCKSPAMKNGRCRMHGGKSTGPRTHQGLKKSRRANYKHGEYSREMKELRKLSKLISGSAQIIEAKDI